MTGGRGNGDDVLRAFEAGVAAQIELDDIQAHLDLGRAYVEMGRFDDAALEFEQVLQVDPSNAVARAEFMAGRMKKSTR
jgi:Flp pilus assembly protein TadD